jgi:hypothetical protein
MATNRPLLASGVAAGGLCVGVLVVLGRTAAPHAATSRASTTSTVDPTADPGGRVRDRDKLADAPVVMAPGSLAHHGGPGPRERPEA